MATRITVRDNGPLMVEGEVELITMSGRPIEAADDKDFLCRCGGSTKKPFCDGTHSKIGFQGAEAAVFRMEQKRAA